MIHLYTNIYLYTHFSKNTSTVINVLPVYVKNKISKSKISKILKYRKKLIHKSKRNKPKRKMAQFENLASIYYLEFSTHYVLKI